VFDAFLYEDEEQYVEPQNIEANDVQEPDVIVSPVVDEAVQVVVEGLNRLGFAAEALLGEAVEPNVIVVPYGCGPRPVGSPILYHPDSYDLLPREFILLSLPIDLHIDVKPHTQHRSTSPTTVI